MNLSLIDAVDEWKRDVLSPYCLNDCLSRCCYIDRHARLSEEELRVVLGLGYDIEINNLSRFKGVRIKKTAKGLYIPAWRPGNPCPSLDENSAKCLIHEDKNRPGYCGDFPVWASIVKDSRVLRIIKCVGVRNSDISGIVSLAGDEGFRVRIE